MASQLISGAAFGEQLTIIATRLPPIKGKGAKGFAETQGSARGFSG